MLGPVLAEIFGRGTVDELRCYFAAGFPPLFVSAARLAPHGESGIDYASLKWHCDAGPRARLEMLVYLDDAASHDGATALLDKAATAVLDGVGCAFTVVEARLEDVAPFARHCGLALDPIRPSFGRGEAILFEPVHMLHRGMPPSRGARHVPTVGLVPWPRRKDGLDRAIAFYWDHFAANRATFPKMQRTDGASG